MAKSWEQEKAEAAERRKKRDKGQTPKPVKKNKSRKERTADADVDKLIPLLGTLFFSKDPTTTALATQTLSELAGTPTGKVEGSLVRYPSPVPKHMVAQIHKPSVDPVKSTLHELIHVLQRVLRPGEKVPLPRAVAGAEQILKQEIGAWAPQVQRGVEGGIKTIQDISRSGGLPSYMEGYSVPYGQGAEAAKRAMIVARQAGGVASPYTSIARTSQARITPDIVAQVKKLLASKETITKLGPANLQALAPLGATQALRALLNLPALKGILPMLSPEKMDEIFRKVMPFSGVRG